MVIVVIDSCPRPCGPPQSDARFGPTPQRRVVGSLSEQEVLDARQVADLRISSMLYLNWLRTTAARERRENSYLAFHSAPSSTPLPFVRRSVGYGGAVAPRATAALLGRFLLDLGRL